MFVCSLHLPSLQKYVQLCQRKARTPTVTEQKVKESKDWTDHSDFPLHGGNSSTLSFCFIRALLPQIAAGVSYLTSRKWCVNMKQPVTCSPCLLWVSGVGIACLLNLVTRGAGVPGSRHFTLKANTCHGNRDVLAGGIVWQVLAGRALFH